ncbi:hypothetical protein RIF29_18929 [Crotalaria pallida]|uniref:RRM domain-containing protein n=1 Tax=Crotalaria pallida TaxID=3830 RepID=A0AAN9EZT8_CROPI
MQCSNAEGLGLGLQLGLRFGLGLRALRPLLKESIKGYFWKPSLLETDLVLIFLLIDTRVDVWSVFVVFSVLKSLLFEVIAVGLLKGIILNVGQLVDKALLSMEEEAESIYKDERGLLLDDEAASTRDAIILDAYTCILLKLAADLEEASKEAVKEADKKAFEASFKDCPDDLLAEREAIAAAVAKSRKFSSNLEYFEVLTGIGTIEDIRVQQDKGFGFVRYSTHDEAALAIQMGNARILFGKPIKR